jgi:hypothetical protein
MPDISGFYMGYNESADDEEYRIPNSRFFDRTKTTFSTQKLGGFRLEGLRQFAHLCRFSSFNKVGSRQCSRGAI